MKVIQLSNQILHKTADQKLPASQLHTRTGRLSCTLQFITHHYITIQLIKLQKEEFPPAEFTLQFITHHYITIQLIKLQKEEYSSCRIYPAVVINHIHTSVHQKLQKSTYNTTKNHVISTGKKIVQYNIIQR